MEVKAIHGIQQFSRGIKVIAVDDEARMTFEHLTEKYYLELAYKCKTVTKH